MHRAAHHVLVLLAGAAAALVFTASALAVGSGANGLIYYSVYDGSSSTSHIWAVNPDGSSPHQITSGSGSELDPSVSPDGQTLAYDEVSGNTRQVYTQPIAGGTATNVSGATIPGGTAYAPSYCGDGSIVYVGDPTNSGANDVYRTGVGQVTSTEYPGPGGHQQAEYVEKVPACSSTNAIAFVRNTDTTDPLPLAAQHGDVTTDELWTVPEHQLTFYYADTDRPFGVLSVLRAAWSPDGTQLAFIGRLTGNSDSNQQLFTMNADGSDITPLGDVLGGGFPLGLVWSPDGTSVAYVQSGGDIEVVNVTSFTEQLLPVQSSGSIDWASGGPLPSPTQTSTSTPAPGSPSTGGGAVGGAPPLAGATPSIPASLPPSSPLFTVIHSITLALFLRIGVGIPITVPEPATVTATLAVPASSLAAARSAKSKLIVLGTGTAHGDGTLELTVRLSKLAKSKLHMLGQPGHAKSVTATLTLTTVTQRRRWVTIKRLTIH